MNREIRRSDVAWLVLLVAACSLTGCFGNGQFKVPGGQWLPGSRFPPQTEPEITARPFGDSAFPRIFAEIRQS